MKINLLIYFIILPIFLVGQELKDGKSVLNNILTQYGIINAFSINYERRLLSNEVAVLNVAIGISHSTPNYSSKGLKALGVPVDITSIFGKKKSHFEIGIGYWPARVYNSSSNFDVTKENNYLIRFGYRYQKLNKNGINFRIGIAPTYNTAWDYDYLSTDTYISWYFGAGYSF